jgi:chromosome segregation ATPase
MLAEEQAQITSLSKALAAVDGKLERKRGDKATAVADFDNLTQELERLKQQVVSLGQRQEAAEAGVATTGGEQGGSLTDQLMEAKQAQSKAQTLCKQLEIQLRAHRKEFTEKQRQVADAGAEIERVNQRSSALTRQRNEIQARLDSLGFDDAARQSLIAERDELQVRACHCLFLLF